MDSEKWTLLGRDMKIRPFERTDLEQCLALSKAQHKESDFRYLYLDMNKIRNSYLNSVGNPRFRIFVIEKNKKIIGCCAVSLVQYLWNYDFFVQDHFYYLYPEHRQGLTALKMYRAVEKWAQENRAIEIHFNYGHGSNEKMPKLLNRLGYEKYSDHYRKKVI